MKTRALVLEIEGTPIRVRVLPDTTSEGRLVLKATNEIAAKALCFALDVPILKEWRGQSYFITGVERQSFLQAMDEKLGQLIDGNILPLLAASQAATVEVQVPPALPALPLLTASTPAKCVECGCADGTHWNFCPFNK